MLGVQGKPRRSWADLCCAGFCARLRAAMMIDVFNHFMPQAYLERLGGLIPGHPVLTAFPRIKSLWDVDARRARIRRRHA